MANDPHPGPHTLAIDIGGTGLKAIVLDAEGNPENERLRVPTTYPCGPDKLVADLVALVKAAPPFDRISVGFPGVVRDGKVLTAPAFSTESGLGGDLDPDLVHAWDHFDLAATLSKQLGKPCRAANDADVQGAGAVSGVGLELIVTLGTGVGTAVFSNGALALHLELAHHPVVHDETYNEYLGDAAYRREGKKKWNKRVVKAVGFLDTLVVPDAILLGGGNAKHVSAELPAKVRIISNEAGLLGGIRLWSGPGLQ